MKRISRLLAGPVLALMVLFGTLGLLPAGDHQVDQAAAAPALSSEDGTRDSITPTTLDDDGITQTLAAASGDGHKFTNGGREFVVVNNGYTATVTMTVVTGGSVDGHAIDDITVGLSAGQTKIVGPFRTSIFNQPSGSDAGQVYLNWNATVTGTVADSVTLAVYRIYLPQ